QVGEHVLRLVSVERERLSVSVHRDDAIGHPDELARPDSRPGGELEDAAARRERLERCVCLGDVRPPARERGRLELVAAPAVPPVVVSRRPRRVVALLLLHTVVHDTAWKIARATSAPTAPP